MLQEHSAAIARVVAELMIGCLCAAVLYFLATDVGLYGLTPLEAACAYAVPAMAAMPWCVRRAWQAFGISDADEDE